MYILGAYVYIHTYIHTYMHTCIHAYIHTYTHTYIHTYIHTVTHTYIHTYIHTYLHWCMYARSVRPTLVTYIHLIDLDLAQTCIVDMHSPLSDLHWCPRRRSECVCLSLMHTPDRLRLRSHRPKSADVDLTDTCSTWCC
jgi:hypothetical protein